MIRPNLPLNALRAFEASARHLSFTQAGMELCVTQAAISHHVKSLEEILGVQLFRRLPRGLALTDEGQALAPALHDAFRRIAATLDQFQGGQVREVLTVAVVGTFAVGWLLPRLERFRESAPFVDLRLLTHNNRVDLAGEGLDCAIRFGDGAWHGTEALRLMAAPLSPCCIQRVAETLRRPEDLAQVPLLRSYRSDEWPRWFAAAGAPCPPIRGIVFDSSLTMAEAAAQGAGVGLLPVALFGRDLNLGRLVQPFATVVDTGSYWLTWLKSQPRTAAMEAFQSWLTTTLAAEAGAP
ncbi:MAG: LysR family transcriptional regulator [Rhodospirillales bacterium 69-11]|nr:LysR family transcriptional regulator [Rhodospirillales bacterium]OJW25353.1 MAG: LysR family transcriptional regulator [Rhodospirillales bacterium 69-11]